jgi:hypothetical protein
MSDADPDDNSDDYKFLEPGPRLDRNRGHIRRCHERWVKNLTRSPRRILHILKNGDRSSVEDADFTCG